MSALPDLQQHPNPLAAPYARFRVADRMLMTAHSHQAWPDVGFEGQVEAWNDAAELVDEKWARAGEKADRVRRGYAKLLGDRDGSIALGQNTHELILRLLSALPLRERPRLVTTDGEFHTLRRQLDRLAEDGLLEIVKVSAKPADAIAERLITATNGRTAAVLASSVLYASAHIVPGLGSVLEHCRRVGAELLVDAYHHVNAVPLSLEREGLGDAFITGAGYKYCQLGEGNGFLRVPPGRDHLRPVATGWFSEFAHLTDRVKDSVQYGKGPARWAGATYDPTSNYRAARVFEFFEREGLSPEVLRAISQHQVGLLAGRVDSLSLDPRLITRDRSVPLDSIGGFLALESPPAGETASGVLAGGVAARCRRSRSRGDSAWRARPRRGHRAPSPHGDP